MRLSRLLDILRFGCGGCVGQQVETGLAVKILVELVCASRLFRQESNRRQSGEGTDSARAVWFVTVESK